MCLKDCFFYKSGAKVELLFEQIPNYLKYFIPLTASRFIFRFFAVRNHRTVFIFNDFHN